MNEMKPQDVMRALECCVRGDCINCPADPMYKELNLVDKCPDYLLGNALALLRRYQAENAEKDAEIERLQRHNTKMARKHYQDGRAEAIDEFAEKLKEGMQDLARIDLGEVTVFAVGEAFIDQIAKEMKEGEGDA